MVILDLRGHYFALPQVRDNPYPCERSSIVAAVTNVLFGTRLGTLYSGIWDYFYRDEAANQPLDQLLGDAKDRFGAPATPAPGVLLKTTTDGNGVGYLLVATAAFRLFGLHEWSLLLMMLTLMALSTALFLRRFPALCTVVTLYFTTLTVMLFTPLVWNPNYALQMPVAGIRYFSLVGILPAFHILLDFLDRPDMASGGPQWNSAILALQAAILTIVLLVRGSMAGLIAAIAIVTLLVAWRHRGDKSRLGSLRRKGAVLTLTALGLLAAVALTVPKNYLTEGRFGTVIWHRVTLSLAINPDWPFPGIKEMFPCEKYIPEGIQPGTPDRTAHCMWDSYVIEHNIPIGSTAGKTYGGEYEAVLRQAFFSHSSALPGASIDHLCILQTAIHFSVDSCQP